MLPHGVVDVFAAEGHEEAEDGEEDDNVPAHREPTGRGLDLEAKERRWISE